MLDISPRVNQKEQHWEDLKTKELRYLNELLDFCDGDKARAAEIAGISVRSLYRKLGTSL